MFDSGVTAHSFFFLSLLFWDNIKKKAPMEARSLTTSDQNFILCGNGFKPTATYFNKWKKKCWTWTYLSEKLVK